MSVPFSVVVPLYNKAPYITETIRSAAQQNFSSFEIIIVDDGSTDESPDLIEAFGDRVRIVHQLNAGPGAARNRGAREAKGDWIAFLDADDLWRPDHLADLARTIKACPEADIVATGYSRSGTAVKMSTESSGAPRYIDFFREHGLVWTSATAIRASLLRQEGFGRAWPGEDIDLWFRLALRHRIAVTSDRTAIYVQNTGGAMEGAAMTACVVPLAQQPIFRAIADTLADPALADRHEAVVLLRNALLREYTLPALFKGQTAQAREYLRALRAGGGKAPVLYDVLSNLPPSIVRAGSKAYSAAKHRLRKVDRVCAYSGAS